MEKIIYKNICIVVAVLIFFCSGCKPKDIAIHENINDNLNYICELSIYKSYYHNVARFNKESSGFKKIFFNIGFKKLWIEYTGIVYFGIDASQVSIEEKLNNEILITMPKAKVLSIDCDENSMSDPVTDTGLFTSITKEEKINAFDEAQKGMKEAAENDSILLKEATNRAQNVLKSFVINYGKAHNQNYTIKWNILENEDNKK